MLFQKTLIPITVHIFTLKDLMWTDLNSQTLLSVIFIYLTEI